VAKVEALYLSAFVVGLLDDLFADVEGGKRQESYVKFEGHWQHGCHVVFEVVLVVGVATEVLGVVSDCLAELFGVVDPFNAKTKHKWRVYLPRVMISLYSISPLILSAIPCVKLWRIGYALNL
jgi:hypothetical protein